MLKVTTTNFCSQWELCSKQPQKSQDHENRIGMEITVNYWSPFTEYISTHPVDRWCCMQLLCFIRFYSIWKIYCIKIKYKQYKHNYMLKLSLIHVSRIKPCPFLAKIQKTFTCPGIKRLHSGSPNHKTKKLGRSRKSGVHWKRFPQVCWQTTSMFLASSEILLVLCNFTSNWLCDFLRTFS